MGILDNEFMRLVLSGSPYMRSRERERIKDQRAGELKTLIGQRYEPGQGQGMLENRGLMGGKLTPEQFAVGAMAIPGYEQMGASMYNQQARQRWGTQENQAARDWSKSNMSMADLARLDAMEQQNQLANTQAQMTRQQNQENKNREFQLQATGQVRDDFGAAIAKYVPSVRAGMNVANILDRYPERNVSKINGADRSAILSNFLTTIRPGEAQNEGDITNLKSAFGFGGDLSGFLSNVRSVFEEGGGALDDQKIVAMVKYMQNKSKMDSDAVHAIKGDWESRFSNYDTNQITVGVPERYQARPFTTNLDASAPTKPAKLSQEQIDRLVPVGGASNRRSRYNR